MSHEYHVCCLFVSECYWAIIVVVGYKVPASTSHLRCFLHLLMVAADSTPPSIIYPAVPWQWCSSSKLGLPTPSFFRALVEERDAQIWRPSKPRSWCSSHWSLFQGWGEREYHFHSWSRSLNCSGFQVIFRQETNESMANVNWLVIFTHTTNTCQLEQSSQMMSRKRIYI